LDISKVLKEMINEGETEQQARSWLDEDVANIFSSILSFLKSMDESI